MPNLGVNIDHVATLRQARREFDPDTTKAALICQKAGADSIVVHLREDRRHIQEKDIFRIKRIVKTRFNLEMSLNEEIVWIALSLKPHQATLVPEKRQEITTEGGLDVGRHLKRIAKTIQALEDKGIQVSLFIDPVKKQIDKTKAAGGKVIELHTGAYARAKTKSSLKRELIRLTEMTVYARSLGLIVNAGHGLKYHNTKPIAQIPGIHELNIGHSIVSRAVFVGLKQAVAEMIEIIKGARETRL